MKQEILIQAAGLLFFAGIILAGSDGAWFPYINFAGVGVSFSGVLMLRRIESARHRGGNNGP